MKNMKDTKKKRLLRVVIIIVIGIAVLIAGGALIPVTWQYRPLVIVAGILIMGWALSGVVASSVCPGDE